MQAEEHLRAGRLTEAIQVQVERVRKDPLDTKARAFLFELLCFAGDYDRAEKHLDVLAQNGQRAEFGAFQYKAVLQAERSRQSFFDEHRYLGRSGPHASPPGKLNGRAFCHMADDDPRIGERLEVLAADTYVWLGFEHIASVNIQPPKRLRDLLWAPASVRTVGATSEHHLGNVFIPVLSPGTWRHADDAVRLGRLTVWEQATDGSEAPFGQKMLVIDNEQVPILELRSLELETVAVPQ